MNSSLLRKQAMEIAGSGAYPRFRFRLIFSLPGRKLEVIRITEKYSESDFLTSFTHDTEIKIAIITADYNLLYANRDNLNVTLVQEQVDPMSNVVKTSGVRYQTKYRAILKDNSVAALRSDSALTNAPYTDGKDEMQIITLQLVDPIALAMANKYAQGIFRFTTPSGALRAMILTQTKEDERKGLPGLLGFQMTDPASDGIAEVVTDFVVENNVRMVKVAAFIQDEIQGIYREGIGSFIQNQRWYIYPPFNTSQFKKTTRRLTIIQSSSLSIPAADKSFSINGDSVTIICTGGVKMQDLSVSNAFNGELGSHYIQASGFLDKPALTDNNQAVYNREQVTADVTTGKRADQNSMGSVGEMTDNLAKVQSKMAAKSGMIMITSWQRSDARILDPGMPVRVYYDNGGNVTTLEGTLIQVNEQWTGEQPGLMANTMKSAASVMLYLKKV